VGSRSSCFPERIDAQPVLPSLFSTTLYTSLRYRVPPFPFSPPTNLPLLRHYACFGPLLQQTHLKQSLFFSRSSAKPPFSSYPFSPSPLLSVAVTLNARSGSLISSHPSYLFITILSSAGVPAPAGPSPALFIPSSFPPHPFQSLLRNRPPSSYSGHLSPRLF